MKFRLLLAVGIAAAIAVPLHAGPFRERLRERFVERMQAMEAGAPRLAPDRTLSYGSDPNQQLDFWKSAKPGAPLIIFVHGGGWQRGSKDNATGGWKAAHFREAGHAFASIDYRLVPDATVEQQAADVAMAVKALVARGAELGIDPHRIVLMGHSAGAHLVALVGTDERYLRAAGLSFADIAGVVPIDGAAYDVPAQMAQSGNFMRPTYQQAFGTDAKRQKALSPTLHAAAPNAPAFLLLHVQRADGVAQNKALETALKAAGTKVERREFNGQRLMGHMEINRRLGDPAYPATEVVDAWLKQVVG